MQGIGLFEVNTSGSVHKRILGCFLKDTVVALQALAKYATTVYVSSEEVSLAVTSTEDFQHDFNIQAANRLVLQQKSLPNVPGVYTLEASGQGCVYVQVSRGPGEHACVGRENLRTTLPPVEPFLYLTCKGNSLDCA